MWWILSSSIFAFLVFRHLDYLSWILFLFCFKDCKFVFWVSPFIKILFLFLLGHFGMWSKPNLDPAGDLISNQDQFSLFFSVIGKWLNHYINCQLPEGVWPWGVAGVMVQRKKNVTGILNWHGINNNNNNDTKKCIQNTLSCIKIVYFIYCFEIKSAGIFKIFKPFLLCRGS